MSRSRRARRLTDWYRAGEAPGIGLHVFSQILAGVGRGLLVGGV
jgi:hypothetical protein